MTVHELFSYGTLLDPNVQRRVFGGGVVAEPASLPGHATVDVRITDPEVIAASGSRVHPGLARATGQSVEGAVLRLSEEQLAAADTYEVADDARRRVLTSAGRLAWAYLDSRPVVAARRLAVVGDSIAYGRTDPAGGWAAAVGAWHVGRLETEHRFYNLAYPGTTAERIRGHIGSELAARKVDTVLLAAGINDLLLDGRPPAEVVQRLERLCELIEGLGIRPVVCGPNWLDAPRTQALEGRSVDLGRVRELREAVARWCAHTLRDHLDPWEVLEDRPELFEDGLHPDPRGHRLLAEWALEQLGAA